MIDLEKDKHKICLVCDHPISKHTMNRICFICPDGAAQDLKDVQVRNPTTQEAWAAFKAAWANCVRIIKRKCINLFRN